MGFVLSVAFSVIIDITSDVMNRSYKKVTMDTVQNQTKEFLSNAVLVGKGKLCKYLINAVHNRKMWRVVDSY